MKKILLSLAVSFLIGAAPSAQAIEMALSSTDPVVDKAKFSEVVDKFLPEKVKVLGPDFKLIGMLETSTYRDGDSFFYYSLMLHRKVIDRDSGKVYWAATGGIRAHGITVGGDEIVKHVREHMVIGANSFKTEQ
ncbi:hypothetical protein [Cupriavidus sp. TMH.W2]|uniref:hypothetical protein n=1 Tax=Cupriavidus sp. TMH.W2 TaxID=3434465 RepID=UPI003D788DB9